MNDQHDRTARAFAAEIIAMIDRHFSSPPTPEACNDAIRLYVLHNYTTRHPASMRAMIRATTNHVHAALTAAA